MSTLLNVIRTLNLARQQESPLSGHYDKFDETVNYGLFATYRLGDACGFQNKIRFFDRSSNLVTSVAIIYGFSI